MRILIVRLSSLGDVVCSLPAAAALKKGIPGAHITWSVRPKFRGVVDCCTAVDEVAEGKPLGEFDLALDLQGLLKSGSVMAFVKAKKKLGYHWQREGSALFSGRVQPDPSSLHVVDQYVDVARAAGGEADFADFALRAQPADLQSVREKLGPDQDFVAINPGAAWAAKQWPPSQVASFLRLCSEAGLRTVLIGTDTAISDAVKAKLPGFSDLGADLIGKTTVPELISLISLSKAHIGGDTGSSHIAAALGVPAIGLYSSTRPERSCPYGQIDRCIYNPNGLAEISPSDVFTAVREAVS